MGKRRKCRDRKNCAARLSTVEKTLKALSVNLERAHFYDYIEYAGSRRRVLARAFTVGLLKGVGTAIGFTVLGAFAIYLLQQAAKSNLPYIAKLMTEIINIIESRK